MAAYNLGLPMDHPDQVPEYGTFKEFLDYLDAHGREFRPLRLVTKEDCVLIVPLKWLESQHQEALLEDQRREALPVQ